MQNRKAEQACSSKIRSHAGWLLLALVFTVSGCATSVTVAPGKPVIRDEPSVARLRDGRQGFVIRESPAMGADARAEFERAVGLMNDGNPDKAIEVLTKVIEQAPAVTPPHINIAEAYLRTGKKDAAEQHFKTALALVPGHPVASNEYGLLLRKAGRFQEAREVYEKAIAQFPEYLPVHRNLGILCDLYLNDPGCALKHYEIYSAGMPGDEKARIWIAELRMRMGDRRNER